jgi:hypothetical protein
MAMTGTQGEFSVCQFFEDGSYEYVRRNVGAEEAVNAAKHYTSSVGAQLGTTRRVIITDGGDSTNFEWKYGEGVTYPPRDDAGKFVADENGSDDHAAR